MTDRDNETGQFSSGRKNRKWWYVGGAAVVILVIVFASVNRSTITPGVFSIDITDVNDAAHEFDDNDVQWSLYGVKATDSVDKWSDYVLLDSGTDLSDLTEADLDADYARFWANFTATNDEEPWRAYAEQWIEVKRGQANPVVLAETPMTEGVIAINEAFTVLASNMSRATTQAQVLDGTDTACTAFGNFSLHVGINASEAGKAAYKGCFNPRAQAQGKFLVLAIFNSTAVLNTDLELVDYSTGSWARSVAKYNASAIAFETTYLSETTVLQIQWDDSVGATLKIMGFACLWMGTDGSYSNVFQGYTPYK